jgi:hypothetical protein
LYTKKNEKHVITPSGKWVEALRLRVVGAGLVECLESDFYTALNPTIYCDCGRSSHDLIMQLVMYLV